MRAAGLLLLGAVLGLAAGWLIFDGPAGHERITEWRAPGARPLSDGEAAGRVRDAPEDRPGNARFNRYRPSRSELAAFRSARYTAGVAAGQLGSEVIPTVRHVTGAFSGTTDEILQWAAHKWGIPEDVVRAAAMEESGWKQTQQGDERNGVMESRGIMQVKWRAEGTLHPGTEPLRQRSTAFNVDYWAANVRFYYDGAARSFFAPGERYEAGRGWASVAAWFLPTPWQNPDAQAYAGRVAGRLEEAAWR